ncbi:MAG: sigma-70 family RNA polymerase sigma factor [Bacteroidales bacterium]|nr:sigma-70 family RNA polymerase sigma factor [Bacteroidales bacterium]
MKELQKNLQEETALYACKLTICRKFLAWLFHLYNPNSIIEQETLRKLFVAIDKLPEKYRQIFEMSFEQGLKTAQIAQQLGISESTIKKRKSKMIKTLRNELGDIPKSILLLL